MARTHTPAIVFTLDGPYVTCVSSRTRRLLLEHLGALLTGRLGAFFEAFH